MKLLSGPSTVPAIADRGGNTAIGSAQIRISHFVAIPDKIVPVLWALLLLAVFMFARAILISGISKSPTLSSYLGALALAAAIAIAGWRIRLRDIGGLFARLGSASALGMAIYFVVEPTAFVATKPDQQLTATLLRYADFLAIVAAIAGFWRPSLLVIPAVHIIAARLLSQTISGLPTSIHDILYLAEACMFVAAGAFAFTWLANARKNFDRHAFTNCVAFIAIGFHIANYFWSGIAKIRLSGAPFEWLYSNDVSRLLVVAIEKGVAPLGPYPAMAQFAHDALSSGLLFFNGFVLAIQLFALVTVARLFWLRLSAICYDALHIGVYVFSGILFWPWIWMNGVILWALRGESEQSVGNGPKVCAAIAIMASGMPFLGSASWLGWYDVASTRTATVEAQAQDSEDWVRVPLSFFGAHAYPVSHGWFDRSPREGHYPAEVAGLARTADRLREDRNCPATAPVRETEPAAVRENRLNNFDAFMRIRHAEVLRETKQFGPYSYYLRLHHHTAIPALHGAFHAIPLERIERYRLVTRSICLSLDNGKLSRRVLKEDAHVVELR